MSRSTRLWGKECDTCGKYCDFVGPVKASQCECDLDYPEPDEETKYDCEDELFFPTDREHAEC